MVPRLFEVTTLPLNYILDGGMSYASDIQMGSLSQSPNAPSLSTAQTGGSRNSQNGTPIVNGTPFIPDFGLSALTSLTQIAKLTQKDTPNSLLASNPAIPNHLPNHHPATIGANLAQSLTNQNLASLGTLSLEAFKQVRRKIRYITLRLRLYARLIITYSFDFVTQRYETKSLCI